MMDDINRPTIRDLRGMNGKSFTFAIGSKVAYWLLAHYGKVGLIFELRTFKI